MRLDSIKISKVEKVQLVDRIGSKKAIPGTLYITTTHFMFVANESNRETWVLHSHIDSVERGQITAAGCWLIIRCKTYLTLNLLILRDKECQEVLESLTEMSQPPNIQEVYAFSYVPGNRDSNISDGWNSEVNYEEYARQGLPNHNWVLSDFNLGYAHCDTYPEKLFVPRNVPKQILIGSYKFRSRGRLPVLSYFYKNEATLCRCSQPLAGFSARCVEDEELLQYILKTNSKSNVLYIVDTRPKINAMANKASGKGFENESNYNNMKFYFFGIENIHIMRTSLQKLLEVCSNRSLSTSSFLSALENNGWLKHIRSVLETATFIAESLTKGVNVVVHCSDGWDRTAQTVSLACMLIDPYFRTLKGFQVLVEKEWLSFGHKFSDRCGHVQQADNNGKEVAPIFSQFLDCVWQMTQQYPNYFEFNECFLLTVNDHVYSCQFGTFLGNSEKERRDLKLSERTYSFWAYVDNNRDEYINPLYCSSGQSNEVLSLDIRPQFINFWRSMYNRFDSGVHPRENFCDLATQMKDKINALQAYAEVLNETIGDLKLTLHKASADKSVACSPAGMQDSGSFTAAANGNITYTADVDGMLNEIIQLQISHNKVVSDSESGYDDLLTPSSVHPHHLYAVDPLTTSSSHRSSFSTTTDQDGVNISWRKLRDACECSACGSFFTYCQRKYNCWHCGVIFCRRCIFKLKNGNVTKIPTSAAATSIYSLLCRNCHALVKLTSPL